MSKEAINPRKCGNSIKVGKDYICMVTGTPCKLLYEDKECALQKSTSDLEEFFESIVSEVDE